jgi:hypothetical protein
VLLPADGGGERERPAAGESLLQGGNADLGLIGEVLAGDSPTRQLLAHERRDRTALLVGELLLGIGRHHQPGIHPHNSSHIRTVPPTATHNTAALGRRLPLLAEQSRT